MPSRKAFGAFMPDECPTRCVRCRHARLLLLVFADGLIHRARVGCCCESFPVYRDEGERVRWGRDELIALCEGIGGYAYGKLRRRSRAVA